jgi:hypothetical protein
MADTSSSHDSNDVCHVFLSHAGEQKKAFVDCMHQLLVREGSRGKRRDQCINVFLDQHSLKAGSSAWSVIKEKAQTCHVGTRTAETTVQCPGVPARIGT